MEYTDKEKQGATNMRGEYLKGQEPIIYDSVVEVLKNRITGVLPKVDLYFDYPSYRFYKTPKELWFRYSWDKSITPLPTNDPNPHIIPQREEVSPL